MDKKLSRTLPSRSLEFSFVNQIPVKIESTGALIYCINTNRYLFLLRSGSRFSDTWSIPGGKIEAGESIIDALKRELAEEINFNISNQKLIPLETYTAANQAFAYHTFIIVVDREFIPELNNEHKAYAWTGITDVPKPIHPGLFKTIRLDEIQQKIKTVETQSLFGLTVSA
jgi:8-oxo-dGTP pyrophosphatase MutT (NUDIX family)